MADFDDRWRQIFSGDEIDAIKSIVDDLLIEAEHETFLFPEGTDETVTFVAGGVANAFGTWAEIADNNAVTFSSKLLTQNGHISSVIARNASDKDVEYIFEIAYGDGKINAARLAVLSGTNQLSNIQQDSMRSVGIPPGETVYYRMKCEIAGATLDVRMRYHCHD